MAFVRDSGEAEPRTTQRVMVGADHAEVARRIIDEALGEGQRHAESETANAKHLERAAGGHGPRAYGRIVLWSAAAFALVAGIFLLLRL